MMPKTIQGICRLCGNEGELQTSHIIPSFVTDWLRETAPTGKLRMLNNINKRVEDGEKKHLLCGRCEQIFGTEEDRFAKHLFNPLHKQTITRFEYREWLLRFGISVVWRALVYQGEEGLSHLSEEQLEKTRKAEKIWREYLLNKRSNPGVYGLYVFPLLGINPVEAAAKSGVIAISPFISRHLNRAVGMDVVEGPHDIYVYAKLGRILLVGAIEVDSPPLWRPSMVSLKQGVIDASVAPSLPPKLFRYINDKANQQGAAFKEMSERQKDKLDTALFENLEAVANSETYAGFLSDLQISGDTAFRDYNGNEDDQ